MADDDDLFFFPVTWDFKPGDEYNPDIWESRAGKIAKPQGKRRYHGSTASGKFAGSKSSLKRAKWKVLLEDAVERRWEARMATASWWVFDGSTDRIYLTQANGAADFNFSTKFTAVAMIRFDTPGVNERPIFHKGPDGTGGWRCFVTDDGVGQLYFVGEMRGNDGLKTLESRTGRYINADERMLVGIDHDGGRMNIHIYDSNGYFTKAYPTTHNLPAANTLGFGIAGAADGSGTEYDGRIYWTAVFPDFVLTQADYRHLYRRYAHPLHIKDPRLYIEFLEQPAATLTPDVEDGPNAPYPFTVAGSPNFEPD